MANPNVVPPIFIPSPVSQNPRLNPGALPAQKNPAMPPDLRMPGDPQTPMVGAPHPMSVEANPDRTPHPTAPGRDVLGRLLPDPHSAKTQRDDRAMPYQKTLDDITPRSKAILDPSAKYQPMIDNITLRSQMSVDPTAKPTLRAFYSPSKGKSDGSN